MFVCPTLVLASTIRGAAWAAGAEGVGAAAAGAGTAYAAGGHSAELDYNGPELAHSAELDYNGSHEMV